ncbi:hypothetical protein [Candidatus Nardonella dryophthoridicola]|uniref:Uncharacterized protein n=1 Tax=endosymbiont of Metamasius hemipterus TaxID=204627 RepID=A0ABT0TWG5_9GAMM|nr:hypothetical protein [Candidatus Nardonella dryophthoridicola]MCM0158342.1 hypothetical protein [endosymbiont of Metamasius hemipterus]
MGQVILKLKLDVCTRWNSSLDMLKRFCQRKDALLSTLAILQHDTTLCNTDWEIASHAINILEIFNDVTTEISTEKNVSISKLILFINAMEGHVSQFKNCTPLSEIQKMIDIFLQEIHQRFKNIKNNELVTQQLLWIRVLKNYGFKDQSRADQAIQIIKNKLKSNKGPDELFEKILRQHNNTPAVVSLCCGTPLTKKFKKSENPIILQPQLSWKWTNI